MEKWFGSLARHLSTAQLFRIFLTVRPAWLC